MFMLISYRLDGNDSSAETTRLVLNKQENNEIINIKP